ncbi:hypothetical protein IWX90DRAFT_280797 [Phyllosticta citrichinensis]|uniref:Secreted protein n=1 Tax=Phyllosticta citrichinensis TaxID=1130410 RepID=A0ABR1XNN1_9PEZI
MVLIVAILLTCLLCFYPQLQAPSFVVLNCRDIPGVFAHRRLDNEPLPELLALTHERRFRTSIPESGHRFLVRSTAVLKH